MPTKKISFIVSFPFQWYVHKNVYFEFGDRAEVIIDLGTHSKRPDPEILNSIVKLLEKYNVKYRVLNFDDYGNKEYLEEFFSNVEVLVSLWESGCMRILETENIYKVCLTYGVGKELTMVRKSRGIYDLILAYGPRDQALFSLSTKSVAIGIPKFDDYFNNKYDIDLYKHIEKNLDKSKKTILYLPTHSDLSSIDLLKEKFKELSVEYNVIVKLHYFISREDPSILSYFNGSKVILLNDDADLITLFKFADIVVSDNSSVIFDAILANIPTIVADFWDEDFLDQDHKNTKVYKRGLTHALSYSDSIEQVIKREGRIATFKNPEDLKFVLEKNLGKDQYKEERKKLQSELFAYMDGDCAKRAKDEIEKLLSGETKSRKGILYHAYINHENTGSLMYPHTKRILRENCILRGTFKEEINLMGLKIYIVVVHEWRDDVYLDATLDGFKYLEKYRVEKVIYNKKLRSESENSFNSFLTLKNYLQEVGGEDNLVFFVQSGTILNESTFLKQIAIFNQYENMGSLTGYVDFSGIRGLDNNFYKFQRFLYGDIQSDFFISKTQTVFVGSFDNVVLRLSYFNIVASEINNNSEMFMSSPAFKLVTGNWKHCYSADPLKSIVEYRQSEILGMIFLRSKILSEFYNKNYFSGFSDLDIFKFFSQGFVKTVSVGEKLKNLFVGLGYFAMFLIGKNYTRFSKIKKIQLR